MKEIFNVSHLTCHIKIRIKIHNIKKIIFIIKNWLNRKGDGLILFRQANIKREQRGERKSVENVCLFTQLNHFDGFCY